MTGEELRRLRTRQGWTLQEMAERLGVKLNTVWRYEDGRLPIPAPIEKLVLLLAQQAPKTRPRRR